MCTCLDTWIVNYGIELEYSPSVHVTNYLHGIGPYSSLQLLCILRVFVSIQCLNELGECKCVIHANVAVGSEVQLSMCISMTNSSCSSTYFNIRVYVGSYRVVTLQHSVNNTVAVVPVY